MRSILFILLVLSFSFLQCKSQVKNEMQKKPIDQVLKEHQDTLLSVQGVQGFYQGLTKEGNDCIVIMVEELTKEIQGMLPDTLDGYPVILEETGVIKPLQKDKEKPLPQK